MNEELNEELSEEPSEWETCGWDVTYNQELGLCIMQEVGVGQCLYHEREVLVAMIEAIDATKEEIAIDATREEISDSVDVVSTDSISI